MGSRAVPKGVPPAGSPPAQASTKRFLGILSNMTDDLYLALDQGGHASRAILFDARGKALAQSHAPITTRRGAGDTVEHDPAEIVDSFHTALAALFTHHKPAAVTAAGLATQRSSIVCWNRLTGEALSPVISWQDRRNAPLV